jgi:hypothetical protein
MRPSRIRFWIFALPVLSLLIAGFSVGFQYYKVNKVAAELKQDEAEIKRLAPDSKESYNPSANDKPE